MNREIGRHIRQLRTANHMTQDDLARQLHVTRQNISSWETGKSAVSVEFLSALSKLFDVSMEELIYGPPLKRPYKKYQLRYWVCIGICAVMLLAAVLSKLIVLPYLQEQRGTTYDVLPSVLYGISLRLVISFFVGFAICAIISLWGDLRLPQSVKSILLTAAIIFVLTAVFLTTLVAVLYRYPQSQFWTHPAFMYLYRLWLSSNVFQCAIPFITSCCAFLSINK